METLPQVSKAKALMNEATTWSVMKWLREKKGVRATADEANAALDELRLRIQKQWPLDVQSKYTTNNQSASSPAAGLNADLTRKLQSVKEADRLAAAARMEAEKAFDDAEKQLSTRLAREGCQKAIRSWELHEKAIQKAELLIQTTLAEL